jgi:hypothetical protein
MPTTMHRLQISLPQWQAQFLADRAEREGISIAELIRRLVSQVAEAVTTERTAESLWELAGIGEDRGEVLPGIPVSERPELYLTGPASESPTAQPPRAKRKRT